MRSWFCGLALILASSAVPAQETTGSEEPPKQHLYVLPVAFSSESTKHYSAWIERLTAEGLGNAIWQEIEEAFYDDPRYTVLQSPVTHEEFLKVLAARRAAATATASDEPLYALPDKVVTVNTNFFTRADAKLTWGKSARREEFHVTVYLRYYDLSAGRLNVAVPAQADAIGNSPIIASRQATKAAVTRLMERIARAEGRPVKAGAVAK